MIKSNKYLTTLPKPFLKYAGGKQQLLPEIIPRIPKDFKRYYEPFLGGGAVFFKLRPKDFLISDVNKDLIRTYHAIRDNFKILFLVEKAFEKSYGDLINEETFYILRDIYNGKVTSKVRFDLLLQKAYLFIYLNKTCFNGLHRVNAHGDFNVGFGKTFYDSVLDNNNLFHCHKHLSQGQIQYVDFREVLKCPEEGDFVFLDPPYMPISATSNFTNYTADGFTYNDLCDLHRCCLELDAKGVKFMFCNSDCELVHSMFEEFNVELVEARRSINSDGEKRGKINEVLITNYEVN
jgi:DNA adenine methylase